MKKVDWDHFTYRLYYPGILGSMLYEVLRIPFSAHYPPLALGIFAMFISDYIYLYNYYIRNDKNSPVAGKRPRALRFILDFSIATLFGVSYHSFVMEAYGWSFFFILLASLLLLIYMFRFLEHKKSIHITGHLIVLCSAAFSFALYLCCHCHIAVLLPPFCYISYVIVLFLQEKKE